MLRGAVGRAETFSGSEGMVQQVQSLGIRLALLSVFGCGAQRLESGPPPPPRFIMSGNLASHVGFSPGEKLAQLFGDPVVALATTRNDLPLVEHLSIETMGEYIKGGTAAIGKLILAGTLKKVEPTGQRIAGFLGFFRIFLKRGRHRPCRLRR